MTSFSRFPHSSTSSCHPSYRVLAGPSTTRPPLSCPSDLAWGKRRQRLRWRENKRPGGKAALLIQSAGNRRKTICRRWWWRQSDVAAPGWKPAKRSGARQGEHLHEPRTVWASGARRFWALFPRSLPFGVLGRSLASHSFSPQPL